MSEADAGRALRTVVAERPVVRAPIARLKDGLGRHGIVAAVPKIVHGLTKLAAQRTARVSRRKQFQARLRELERLIVNCETFIDVQHLPVGWNVQLFQRFHQIAIQAGRLGGLALFGGHPNFDKDLFVFDRSPDGVIVFDAMNADVFNVVLDALVASRCAKIVRIQSVDQSTSIANVAWFAHHGFRIVYEFIDELSDEISGPLPALVRERHDLLVGDEQVAVVSTADLLHQAIARNRSSRFILNPNGVDVAHWSLRHPTPPEDLGAALASKLPIVAYHGALGNWIDYELLRSICQSGEFSVVLIGPRHDRSYEESGIDGTPHLHYLGPKPYSGLNRYAAYYDVGLVPFKRSSLTDAVSPLKLFEYLAAGCPVVSTDLHECAKYKGCLIAHSTEEFIAQLRRAVSEKSDAAFQAILRDEARANNWEARAREVFQLAGIELADAPSHTAGAAAIGLPARKTCPNPR